MSQIGVDDWKFSSSPRTDRDEAVNQTDLRTRRTPVRLAFANQMNRFVTGDGAPRSLPDRTQQQTGQPLCEARIRQVEYPCAMASLGTQRAGGQVAGELEQRPGSAR
jgi:hypothetical protein